MFEGGALTLAGAVTHSDALCRLLEGRFAGIQTARSETNEEAAFPPREG